MEHKFWIEAWDTGRTGFHRELFHDKLLDHFPNLKPAKGQSVLVPLCGKTKDLLWLSGIGLHVHGVELYAKAVEEFFQENKLSPVAKSQGNDFVEYSYGDIRISCGDFFKLPQNAAYDFVYDRASLVALPLEMRKNYAEVIKRSLRQGGKCLLIVYEYDQTKMDGPPFSVDEKEIRSLYEDKFSIKLVDATGSKTEGPRLGAVEGLQQKVYILEKK